MASKTLYPPIVDSSLPAFSGDTLRFKFRLSKFNVWKDFKTVHISIVKQDTNMNVVNKADDKQETEIEEGRFQKRYRSNGIIIDAQALRDTEDDNLYYVDIKGSEDLYLQSNGTVGWLPDCNYKIQIRLSSVIYNGSSEGQSAWLNSNANNFSEWSTICVVKAINQISYTIDALDIDTGVINDDNGQSGIKTIKTINTSTLNLTGCFKNCGSENIYSYNFILYDEDDNILENSGNIYANKFQDNKSYNYLLRYELQDSKTYHLEFKFETVNRYIDGAYKIITSDGAEIDNRITFVVALTEIDQPDCSVITADIDPSGMYLINKEIVSNTIINDYHTHDEMVQEDSPSYAGGGSSSVMPVSGSSPQIRVQREYLSISEDEEEGRIGIKLKGPEGEKRSGNLCIRRADSRDDFKVWDDIKIFVLKDEDVNYLPVFYDYTIESGVWYKYGVQKINGDGTRGKLNVMREPVMRNFNYSYLLGQNNQQLKLKFDNTIGSFKIQRQEGKVDPIGAEYPSITRNAATKYKTFPLNGLITIWMDEKNTFCDRTVIYQYEDVLEKYRGQYAKAGELSGVDIFKDINLVQYDYIYERDFRKLVLDFLYDGEFKLFKSPTEGNIIVRLTDVNCTPNQSLDRMIYSFTSNAYEMAAPTMENYLLYKFYDPGKPGADFSITETKLGQLQMDFPIVTNNRTENIFDLIYQKYDSQGHDIAGYVRTLKKIHHVKISFEGKPLKISQNGMYYTGNKFDYNGKTFSVFTPNRVYEFDDRLVFMPSDSLYLRGDNDEESSKRTTYITATIDFLYDISREAYVGRQPQTRTAINGIGQFFEECKPNMDIYKDINIKYLYEDDRTYRKLEYITSIEIEANPGTVFAIRDLADTTSGSSAVDRYIVGDTGQLRLYELNNILSVKYLGYIQDDGSIDKRNADVLMNYCYTLSKGTYK